ncbi:hypothetical protein FOMPIDRAFT_1022877 [Fomitopsis schrenkii]|uniref:Uncharacterized protein n=1 Tax=Fomitopsis schrenkii TaxID=2126942 RepID=S8EH48_FOMSC|nr:hypothetical protein FOMPIDRAFT_1022877 [Fomitopsis schrenkii]
MQDNKQVGTSSTNLDQTRPVTSVHLGTYDLQGSATSALCSYQHEWRTQIGLGNVGVMHDDTRLPPSRIQGQTRSTPSAATIALYPGGSTDIPLCGPAAEEHRRTVSLERMIANKTLGETLQTPARAFNCCLGLTCEYA